MCIRFGSLESSDNGEIASKHSTTKKTTQNSIRANSKTPQALSTSRSERLHNNPHLLIPSIPSPSNLSNPPPNPSTPPLFPPPSKLKPCYRLLRTLSAHRAHIDPVAVQRITLAAVPDVVRRRRRVRVVWLGGGCREMAGGERGGG